MSGYTHGQLGPVSTLCHTVRESTPSLISTQIISLVQGLESDRYMWDRAGHCQNSGDYACDRHGCSRVERTGAPLQQMSLSHVRKDRSYVGVLGRNDGWVINLVTRHPRGSVKALKAAFTRLWTPVSQGEWTEKQWESSLLTWLFVATTWRLGQIWFCVFH